MAKLVEERLKVLLEAAGVAKYKLSRRAKDPRSLGEKLIIRNLARDKQYSSIEEIKRDIVDLAGVRIILYMPTQEDNQKVEEVIQKEWGSDVIPKMHPPQVSDKNRGRSSHIHWPKRQGLAICLHSISPAEDIS